MTDFIKAPPIKINDKFKIVIGFVHKLLRDPKALRKGEGGGVPCPHGFEHLDIRDHALDLRARRPGLGLHPHRCRRVHAVGGVGHDVRPFVRGGVQLLRVGPDLHVIHEDAEAPADLDRGAVAAAAQAVAAMEDQSAHGDQLIIDLRQFLHLIPSCVRLTAAAPWREGSLCPSR